ncbi:MAG TPA: cupredoxin domain-containing protein [bacterium]|nr:cupredoxin domain-containing protein [bacterium]
MTLTRTRVTLSAAAILCAVGAAVLAFAVPQTHASVTVNSGDLIRGESFSAVYYVGEDGFRYVFPNDKAYFTWYTNFDTVKVISDADLADIQIGGNITYKPGVKMVKINTDPKTYAVAAGGVLRHVTTEAVAISLYGSNWNQKIDDIADGFFPNYTIGDAINSSADFNPASVTAGVVDINADKDLMASEDFVINDDGYENVDITIQAGQGVRFVNEGSENHTATADDLDWGTGTLMSGDSFIRVFDTPGTYTFFDSYDSANTGAIYVE